MNEQRRVYAEGRLPEERKRALEAVGFVWRIADTEWAAMYERLARSKDAAGHCRPLGDRRLQRWVSAQRLARREGRLTAERIAALDSLGIDWDPAGLGARWEARMSELRAFRERKGHCMATHDAGASHKLVVWCPPPPPPPLWLSPLAGHMMSRWCPMQGRKGRSRIVRGLSGR